eukprot:UN25107
MFGKYTERSFLEILLIDVEVFAINSKLDRNNALSHFNVGLIYDNQERWIFAKHH